jgi:CHAT domain-containing protein
LTALSAAQVSAQTDDAAIDKLLDDGFASVATGKYTEMEAAGREALRLSEASGDRYRTARALILLGSAHYNESHIPEAFDELQRGEQLAIALDDIPLRKLACQMLGNTLRNMGRYGDALQKFEEWRVQNRRLPNPEPQGRMTRALGIVYFEMSDVPRAEAMFREALTYARGAGDIGLEGQTLLSLAIVQKSAGRLREAVSTGEEALARARAFGNMAVQAEVLNTIGDAYRQLGDLAAAVERFESARDIATSIAYNGLLAQVTERLGAIEAARGRYAEAIDGYRRAAETYAALGNPPEKRWTVEQGWARAARALGRRAEATAHFSEAVRLIEALEAGTVPTELERALPIATRRNVFEEASDVLLEDGRTGEALEMADRSRARAFLHGLGDTTANLAIPPLATVDRMRRLTEGGRVLVEFMLGDDYSAVWALGDGGVAQARLPGRSRVDALVTAERAELNRSVTALNAAASRRAADRRARELYQMLLAPIAGALAGATSVLIVPDGSLAYVPFEALRPTDTAYLVEQMPISYAQSAASALALLDRPRQESSDVRRRALIAFGDPAYEPPSRGGAPQWTPLPSSRAEVTAISARYPQRDREIRLGRDATDRAVQSIDLRPFKYVHFAVHGFIDADDPAHSGLALARAPGSDGLLQVDDIMALRLDADVVTLSACRTAAGPLLNGEGLLSLGRPFFYAGARRVVGTLWDVNDASTAALMETFYARLNSGVPVAEALRQAKLSLIRGPRAAWTHPHHWSAFIEME